MILYMDLLCFSSLFQIQGPPNFSMCLKPQFPDMVIYNVADRAMLYIDLLHFSSLFQIQDLFYYRIYLKMSLQSMLEGFVQLQGPFQFQIWVILNVIVIISCYINPENMAIYSKIWSQMHIFGNCGNFSKKGNCSRRSPLLVCNGVILSTKAISQLFPKYS